MYKVQEGIIINRDTGALKAYKKRKQKDRTLHELQNEVENLRSDMDELKSLIKGLYK